MDAEYNLAEHFLFVSFDVLWYMIAIVFGLNLLKLFLISFIRGPSLISNPEEVLAMTNAIYAMHTG